MDKSIEVFVPNTVGILFYGVSDVSENNFLSDFIEIVHHFLEMLSVLLLFDFSLTHHLGIQDRVKIDSSFGWFYFNQHLHLGECVPAGGNYKFKMLILNLFLPFIDI